VPKTQLPRIIVAALFLTAVLNAQCAKDNREDKKGGIKVTDFTISGTTTLTSDELLRMTGDFIGNCYADDREEVEERLRAAFQDEDYFGVEVKKMDLKPGDPLAIPKPVTIEAEIVEGPRYKLAEIDFVGNHAFPAERLRREFPMKKGDVFRRGVVASGLDSLRELYGTAGYLDFTPVPETMPASNATLTLNLTIDEGRQYHMGKLDIVAGKEVAARLQAAWKLPEGSPYDKKYIDDFIATNRTLLPSGFSRENVDMGINCPEAQVSLRLTVDPTEDTSHSKPESVPCGEPKDDASELKIRNN
jgi:outer membrane protein assembly factor BamA